MLDDHWPQYSPLSICISMINDTLDLLNIQYVKAFSLVEEVELPVCLSFTCSSSFLYYTFLIDNLHLI